MDRHPHTPKTVGRHSKTVGKYGKTVVRHSKTVGRHRTTGGGGAATVGSIAHVGVVGGPDVDRHPLPIHLPTHTGLPRDFRPHADQYRGTSLIINAKVPGL